MELIFTMVDFDLTGANGRLLVSGAPKQNPMEKRAWDLLPSPSFYLAPRDGLESRQRRDFALRLNHADPAPGGVNPAIGGTLPTGPPSNNDQSLVS